MIVRHLGPSREYDGRVRDTRKSAIREVLGAAVPEAPASSRRSERVLRFSRPMFEHIAQHLRAAKGGMGPRSRTLVHERLRS